jgi:hypothetical protein
LITVALLRSAVLDTLHLGGVVILGIVLLEERSIAHRSIAQVACTARRVLVVKVKVLCAALLTLAIHTSTTMASHHLRTVDVALVISISKVVLVVLGALLVTRDHRLLGREVDSVLRSKVEEHLRPLTVVVNLLADLAAVIVIRLACFGQAILAIASTFGQELFLGVVVEHHINVAFDPLGGRPIDLAVLLQALLGPNFILVDHPACLHALAVSNAGSKLAAVPSALATLELPLRDVSIVIHIQVSMVRFLASLVLRGPICESIFKGIDVPLQPASELGVSSALATDFWAGMATVCIAV